jgi:hypothetical protein
MELVTCGQGGILVAATSDALRRHLVQSKTGDPLGTGAPRPPAPSDPDEYDLGRENALYARSMFSEKERRKIDAVGILSIDRIRRLVADHTIADEETDATATSIDPEMILRIDAHTNYKVFLAGDNIYTREELYDNFPFYELGVQPEAVFAPQEVGKFINGTQIYYRARDAHGDGFSHGPAQVAKTKVYIGRQDWTDFEAVARLARSSVRIMSARRISGAMPPAAAASPAAAVSSPTASPAAMTAPAAAVPPAPDAAPAPPLRVEVMSLRGEVAALANEIAALRAEVAALRAEVVPLV